MAASLNSSTSSNRYDLFRFRVFAPRQLPQSDFDGWQIRTAHNVFVGNATNPYPYEAYFNNIQSVRCLAAVAIRQPCMRHLCVFRQQSTYCCLAFALQVSNIIAVYSSDVLDVGVHFPVLTTVKTLNTTSGSFPMLTNARLKACLSPDMLWLTLCRPVGARHHHNLRRPRPAQPLAHLSTQPQHHARQPA